LNRLFFIYLALFFCACDNPEAKNEQSGKKRELVLPIQAGKPIFREVVEEVRGVGNIQAEQRVVVTSEVKGRLVGIHFQEGRKVQAGQKLVSIDPRDYQLEIKKLEADLAASKQEYEKATSGLRPEEKEKLRAQTRASQSALDLSIKERARTQQLVEDKVVSQSDLDIANDRVQQAKETLSSNQAALNGALKSREEDISQKDSDREAVARQLERAKLALSKTTLRAPFDGIILSKKIEEGAYASSGTPILEMIGSSKLKAVIEIPQSFREKLSKLTNIKFSVKDLRISFNLKGEALEGVRVIPDSNIFSGNIPIQINLPEPDPSLFPGLTLEAIFKFEARKNVLHVPSIALVITERGSVVYSIKDQKANLIPVKALKEKNDFTEIQDFTNQLSQDTPIILRGASAVFPGVKVMQVNVDPKK
jgi:HlyD family secretion protein